MGKQRTAKAAKWRPDKNIAILIVLLVCAVIVVSTGFFGGSNAVNWAKGLFVDKGAVMNGTLKVDGVEPIDDVPKGEVRFYINKNVVFENTYAKGNIVLQNPEKCEYILEFRFYYKTSEDGAGTLMYKSPMLKPGQYLSGDKLSIALDEGTYDCTYTVRAYPVDAPDELYGETSGYLTTTIKN